MADISKEDRAFWRAINSSTRKIRHDTVSGVKPTPKLAPSTKLSIARTNAIIRETKLCEQRTYHLESIPKRTTRSVRIEASLDLHGMSQKEAEQSIFRFLHFHQQRRTRWVRIITGKSGILRQVVPDILSRYAFFTSGYTHPKPHQGGVGALYVRIRLLP